jgi:cytochrome b
MRKSRQTIIVWDHFIRVFHWTLVATYLLAWASAEDWQGLHERSGYFILVLLGLRLLWGLIGTRHARFRNFVRTPKFTLEYLRSLALGNPQDHLGHNPAAGWMIVALIVVLGATALTGVAAVGGPEYLEDLHEGLAGLSLFMVTVHVMGVIASSFLHGENLVAAMLTGKKTRRTIDV